MTCSPSSFGKYGASIKTECDSEAEAYFDYIVLQCGLDIVEQNKKYRELGDFPREKSTLDRVINYKGKLSYVEIWGIHQDSDRG